MGVYENILTELICQSDINLKLLMDVNKNMYEDDNGAEKADRFSDIKDKHKERVGEYRGRGVNPPYDYFDGTQLINSLFLKIVVPVEWLKSIANSKSYGINLSKADSHSLQIKQLFKVSL